MINAAINQTLSRTVLTSLTVFLVVAVLFLFGGEVLRDFAFVLLVGVVTGTYSTIFVAAPIILDWEAWSQRAPVGRLEKGRGEGRRPAGKLLGHPAAVGPLSGPGRVAPRLAPRGRAGTRTCGR